MSNLMTEINQEPREKIFKKIKHKTKIVILGELNNLKFLK
jgi:hypothetical protein